MLQKTLVFCDILIVLKRKEKEYNRIDIWVIFKKEGGVLCKALGNIYYKLNMI